MTYQVTIPATTSLVTVAELQTHLMLFGDTSYDTELQDILLTAEGFISGFLDDFLVSTTVRQNLYAFGDTTLHHKNPTSVVVSYWDANNTAQVWASSNYVIDTSDVYPTIIFDVNPTGQSTKFANKGYITYDTVLTPIPTKVNHAVLLVAAELFESRREVSNSITYAAPIASKRLIQSLRGW